MTTHAPEIPTTIPSPDGQFSGWLAGMQPGKPRKFGQLGLVPLPAWRSDPRDYLLLGEAIAQRTFHITEVSEQGSVPELLAVNQGDRPVLLIDGEELIGARQNRVLNLTVLIPANSKVTIPVSCVEQGRWRYTSAAFGYAERTLFAKARAQKSRDVTQSMARGAYASDQGALWDAVAEKLDALRAASPTRAMSDAYTQRAHSLEEYVSALSAADGECGAIFTIGDVPVAVEAFDSADAFSIALPALIRSYALDAMQARAGIKDGGSIGPTSGDSPEVLLQRIGQLRPARYPAIGLGDDLRVEHEPGLTGGALLLGDRLVHISVFDTRALEQSLHEAGD